MTETDKNLIGPPQQQRMPLINAQGLNTRGQARTGLLPVCRQHVLHVLWTLIKVSVLSTKLMLTALGHTVLR
jgi:hypothetical protein